MRQMPIFLRGYPFDLSHGETAGNPVLQPVAVSGLDGSARRATPAPKPPGPYDEDASAFRWRECTYLAHGSPTAPNPRLRRRMGAGLRIPELFTHVTSLPAIRRSRREVRRPMIGGRGRGPAGGLSGRIPTMLMRYPGRFRVRHGSVTDERACEEALPSDKSLDKHPLSSDNGCTVAL